MRNMKMLSLVIALFLTGLYSCKKDEIDDQKPVIDLAGAEIFPLSCDTIYFGEPFTLKLAFTDNKELGSYSINIHDNFDHHSHSTEVTVCEMWPVKTPVNPYVFIDEFSIPSGMTTYQVNQVFEVPLSNSSGLLDEGDYHFFISLTDKEGWSAQKGLSIKMLRRN